MPREQIEFTGVVQSGHLPSPIRTQISDAMRRAEGKRLKVVISEVKRSRSLSQNAFYWGMVVPRIQDMFAESGNDADAEETHAYLKEHVGGLKIIVTDPSGLKRSVPGSSRKLTTMQWEDYMTKIRAWAAQFEVEIPLPNEVL